MATSQKLKDFCKKMIKMPMFYFCLCFLLINIFFTQLIFEDIDINFYWVVLLVEISVEVVVLFLVYLMRRRGVPLQKQFLLVAGVLGILFIIIMPPGQAPDEITHFRRVYGISDGVLIPGNINDGKDDVGSLLPNNLEEVFGKGLPKSGTYSHVKKILSDNEIPGYTEQRYNGAAVYSFVCYIPQTLAILIGKVLGFSIIGMAYLIRIFNLIIWIILVYFAIKFIPKFKGVVLFISLLPIVLQEATSMSPDALTIGLGKFLVAYVLYLTYTKKSKLKKRELALLCGVAILMGFCKIVYFPLLLLYITIPYERFGSKKKKWWFLGILAVVIAALILAWLMASATVSVGLSQGVNPKGQITWILSNPFDYLLVILRTMDVYIVSWMNIMLGMSLGAFVFNISNVFFLISFAIFIMLFSQRDERLNIRIFDRGVFIAVFVIIMMLICASLYIQWTAVGAERIEGIQGRYFLPILLLVPVMICRNKNKKQHTALITDKAIICYSLFVNVIALVTIFAQNI